MWLGNGGEGEGGEADAQMLSPRVVELCGLTHREGQEASPVI